VSVIVPCRDAATVTPRLVRNLLRIPGCEPWEFLFIDDGLEDEAKAVLRRLARPHSQCRVFRHPSPLGLGAALRTGFSLACAPVVASMDPADPEGAAELPNLVSAVAGGLDMAMAWRPPSRSPYCWRGSASLLRAYRKAAVDRLHFLSSGSWAAREILLRAWLAGWRVAAIPPAAVRPHLGAMAGARPVAG
jgi:glycosyltransferase involved in cell wall biosynthesis